MTQYEFKRDNNCKTNSYNSFKKNGIFQLQNVFSVAWQEMHLKNDS